MKRLQITSISILIVGIICFSLWRTVLLMPDWFVRVTGIIMLISLFTLAFSSAKLYTYKNDKLCLQKQDKNHKPFR